MSARWSPFSEPWVIAHRGASGLLPEHTLPCYALAIEQGAEVIEPDLVASSDGVLFARHDLGLTRSTDILSRPEFADRRTIGADGREEWWIADFRADEVRSLRAVQPWPERPKHRDGVYPIPELAQILELLVCERRRRERPILVYPELKEPAWFAERGIDLVSALEQAVTACGLTGAEAPILVQCFDRPTLARVRERTGLRVILLSATLPAIDPDLDGYGIHKGALLDDAAGAAFLSAAHARGQMVHAWTFRDDQPRPDVTPLDECSAAFAAGIDGLFCDFPATGLRARRTAGTGISPYPRGALRALRPTVGGPP